MVPAAADGVGAGGAGVVAGVADACCLPDGALVERLAAPAFACALGVSRLAFHERP